MFTAEDHAALTGDWRWLARIVGEATAAGSDGLVDDLLAYVRPWGFDPAQVRCPALFVHGEQDRMVPSGHSEWLAKRVRGSELWLRPGDGHISVLAVAGDAVAWLRSRLV